MGEGRENEQNHHGMGKGGSKKKRRKHNGEEEGHRNSRKLCKFVLNSVQETTEKTLQLNSRELLR